MKKLLIINHYAGAPKYGMEYRHYDIAKELIAQNIEVCIVASSFTHLRKEPECSSELIDGIIFKWIKTPSYKSFGIGRLVNMFMFSLKLFFKKTDLPFTPDTIIVSSPSPFPIINAIFYKRKYKAKLIYEIRDVWPQSIIELKGVSKNNLLIVFLNWLDTIGIKYADFILSPLENINLYIEEKGFNKSVIILPNGINEVKMFPVLGSHLEQNKFVVGYGGTLGDSNSIMNLISAALILKEEKNILFKIVGDGERKNDIKKVIKKHNLSNIELVGRVDKQKLFEILSGCDILYKGNPFKDIYKYGISSIKTAEYLLLKKPIIDASCGVDVIKKSKSGIVIAHENSEELAKGILEFSKMDKEQLKVLGENGYEYAINNCLYSASVKNMIIKINGND